MIHTDGDGGGATAGDGAHGVTALGLSVDLEEYSGPLDLLLHLIRRDEIDIHDIPIAHITAEYAKILAGMEQLDIRVGGEFLVMASTLLEIKSQLTLAKHLGGPGRASSTGEDELDPRYELVRQLLEYRRFKDAAAQLVALEDEQARRYFHPPSVHDLIEPGTPPDPLLIRADLWDLVASYARTLNAMGTHHPLEIPFDDTPIEVYVDRISARVAAGRVAFGELLSSRSLFEVVGVFLALLELMRQGRVAVAQTDPFGEIVLERGPGREPDDEPGEPRGNPSLN